MEREELAELERLWCPELPFPPPRVGDWGRPGGTNDALAKEPLAAEISIDDFLKVDLRIAQIVAAASGARGRGIG